jgi:PAS domain S-box-containing protein
MAGIKPELSAAELRRKAEEQLALQAPASPVSEKDLPRLLHELQVHQIELELQNRTLREAGETVHKLALAVEQTPHSIVITDLAGTIEYANAAFSAISGYPNAEVLGRNSRFQQSGQTPRATYVDLWQTLTRGQVWRGEINRRKSGELYTESEIIAPVRQADGHVTPRDANVMAA